MSGAGWCGFRTVCVPKTWSVLIWRKSRLTSATMVALLSFLLTLLADARCEVASITNDDPKESTLQVGFLDLNGEGV